MVLSGKRTRLSLSQGKVITAEGAYDKLREIGADPKPAKQTMSLGLSLCGFSVHIPINRVLKTLV